MREILEDAAVIYRQEVEGFLAAVTPAAVLGPLLLIVASRGVTAALATIPFFLLLFLLTYAVCLESASAILRNHGYQDGGRYLRLLRRLPDIIVAAAPAGLLLAAVSASGVVLGDQGFAYLSLVVALLGIVATAHWALRHSFALPLVVSYDLRGRDALDASAQLADDLPQETRSLVATVSLPLVVAGLLGAGLAAVSVPLAGAAVFLLALAAWLPFSALALTGACVRLLDTSAQPAG